MKRIGKAMVLVLIALAVLVVPAFAITGNWAKDFDHPFVAMITFQDADGEFIWRCSGSLIDPTHLVTAGHCADTAEGAVSAIVYFQQDAGANYDPALQQDPVSGYPDTCAAGTLGTVCATSHQIYNYGFANFAGFPDTHDVGLLILDQPIILAEYAVLPQPGILDNLNAKGAKNTLFTISGFGLTYSTQEHSVVPNISFRERLEASSSLVNLGSRNTDGYNIQTQGNGNDRGGTCSGDSGGPVFLGGVDSNVMVAVTSFGMNSLCRGTDYGYRLDRPEVLAWIYSH